MVVIHLHSFIYTLSLSGVTCNGHNLFGVLESLLILVEVSYYNIISPFTCCSTTIINVFLTCFIKGEGAE